MQTQTYVRIQQIRICIAIEEIIYSFPRQVVRYHKSHCTVYLHLTIDRDQADTEFDPVKDTLVVTHVISKAKLSATSMETLHVDFGTTAYQCLMMLLICIM